MPLDDDPESAASGSSRVRGRSAGPLPPAPLGATSAIAFTRRTLKYCGEVKARGRLVVAASVVLLALAVPAAASARGGAHRRHVQVIQPTAAANILFGKHGDDYQVGVSLAEPDVAVLVVQRVDLRKLGVAETRYGAHFRGSLAGGRVTADFGPVGSISLRFRGGGPVREGRELKECEGKPWRRETGHWVGKISLHGEGGYFAVSSAAAKGVLQRSFRQRCRFKSPLTLPPPESLRAAVEPEVGFSIAAAVFGTSASLEAEGKEGGRVVAMRAAHASGGGPGAEVEAGTFEYQGRTPVGRFGQEPEAPSGSLLTTLPGEHPASATVKPDAPFSGEASYLGVSPTDHRWTGTLAVSFPGLTVPLTGPGFFSTLCVVSRLVKPLGCEFQEPSWQPGEEPTAAARR